MDFLDNAQLAGFFVDTAGPWNPQILFCQQR
jgi:hypothetical protein